MEKFSELEQRILAELEEAGEEDVPTIINTVMLCKGSKIELAELAKELESLIKRNYILFSIARDSSQRLAGLSMEESLALLQKAISILEFDAKEGYWYNSNRRAGSEKVGVVMYLINTKSGEEKGVQVLTERGYQWWRSK